MRNLTADQKNEILTSVRSLLDRRDVVIHFQMSREMKQEERKPGDTADNFTSTGAMAVCLSVVGAPAIKWASDIEAEAEEAASLRERVLELPERWKGSLKTSVELNDDLKAFIPELFEEAGK